MTVHYFGLWEGQGISSVGRAMPILNISICKEADVQICNCNKRVESFDRRFSHSQVSQPLVGLR